jgi:WD40 repeat protein
VVTASTDTTARVWDAESGKELALLAGHTKAVNRASFSPDGKRVVTASDDGTARVWDAESGKMMLALPGHPGYRPAAWFGRDGVRIVVTGQSAGTSGPPPGLGGEDTPRKDRIPPYIIYDSRPVNRVVMPPAPPDGK